MEGLLAPWHWIIIIAVILLVFGPKKLPELGNSLGKGISGFRKGLKDVQDEVSSSVSMAQGERAETTTAGEPTREPVLAQTSAEPEEEAKPQA
jgi:sec-independent protein translocase protein TatA